MQTAIPFEPTASQRASSRHLPGGTEREALHDRFRDRLVVRHDLNRRLVSYQANKTQPGLRWFKYKEGFSSDLAHEALKASDGPVLDPFAGIGTAVLVAGGAGRRACGIEIMPVGARAARAISCIGNGMDFNALKNLATHFLKAIDRKGADSAFLMSPSLNEHFQAPLRKTSPRLVRI